MRKDEIVSKNVSLVFDFLRYLTQHPELIEKIPDGCEIEFLDKDSPLTERERVMAKDQKNYFFESPSYFWD